MTPAIQHPPTQAASDQAATEAITEARIAVAIARCTDNGHRMTKPYDNGGDFLMAHCRDCGQLTLASATIASGSALTTQCSSVKPAPQPAPKAPATPNAPVGTWAHRSETFNPSTQATCEYCGNGTTIVGRSCPKCAKSKTLVSDVKRPRHSYMQSGLDHMPVAAELRHHDGIKWKVLTNLERPDQVAPCGKVHDVSVIYVPETYDLDTIADGVKPDRLTAFACHEECIVTRYQPRPQAQRLPVPIGADYVEANKRKHTAPRVNAAYRAVRLATLQVRRAPNTRRATKAAVRNAYNALETYRAAVAADRLPRRSAAYIARFNKEVATYGPVAD